MSKRDPIPSGLTSLSVSPTLPRWSGELTVDWYLCTIRDKGTWRGEFFFLINNKRRFHAATEEEEHRAGPRRRPPPTGRGAGVLSDSC